MSISGIHSGMQIIQQSHHQTETAASDIQKLTTNPEPTSSLDSQPKQDSKPQASQTDALINLNQAQSYNRIGVSVVDRNNEMIGSLLDVQV